MKKFEKMNRMPVVLGFTVSSIASCHSAVIKLAKNSHEATACFVEKNRSRFNS
jgi:hypothetical protein